MANDRGMMAGLGAAVADVGKMSFQDSLEQAKEKRLQQIQLEAESRAETRQIDSEGRAEGRQIAAEGRAEGRADKERGQKNEDEAAADARRHKDRLEEIAAQAREERKNKQFEVDLTKGGPRWKTTTIPGSDLDPGRLALVDEKSGQAMAFDAAANRMVPVGQDTSNAKPEIPAGADQFARALAKQEVASMARMLSTDATDFKEFGGDRGVAEETFYRKYLPLALAKQGYNPADYGFNGLVTDAAAPPPGALGVQAPAPGGPGDVSRTTTTNATSGNAAPPPASVVSPAGGLPPAVAASLREGVETRFRNGQVWTLKGGVPTKVR